MSIMDKINEQKAKQAAAKAEIERLKREVKQASEAIAEIDHPLAPKEEVDWVRLGEQLIKAIQEKEAADEDFTFDTLFEFLEWHLQRKIEQEDANKLMEACGGRLVKGMNYISLKDVEVVVEQPKATGGLSNYIDTMLQFKKNKCLPGNWNLAQVESFWKKALMALSSSEVLTDTAVRTMAKEAVAGNRLPRSSTIKTLVKWVNDAGVPVEMSADDCTLRLGVSDHEVAMAEKLAQAPVTVQEPVEEPKTHLKPVGKIEEDVVVTTTPVVEEPKEPVVAEALAPVVIYINAFPSDHIPTKLSTILEPLQEQVAEEKGLAYYNLADYNMGPKHVASKFLALLNGSHASKMLGKSVLASQKDPCINELLPLLERRADIIIVRGFFG